MGGREPAVRAARADGAGRRQERLRAGRVRLLYGPARRRAGLRVPGGRRAGAGPPGRHGRGPGRTGRPTGPDPAGVRGRRRRPVRLLHPRTAGRRRGVAGAQPRTFRRGHPRGTVRQPVPLHGLREDPRRGPAGRRPRGRSGVTAMSERLAPSSLTQGSATQGGIGESTLRPDGILKVTGEFAYSSDLWHEDMLWGRTLRSPVAHARILSIDTAEALATPGVYAVLTYDDLPTDVKHYGLELQDTPVLADGKVRHHGEPVA